VTTVPSKSETLAWLHRISGELATMTLKRLEDTVPWYRDMPSGRRSAVGLVAQAGITSFIEWYNDPTSTPWIASDVFGAAPRELLRSVSLLQTLQLIRVTVGVVEERIMQRETADLRDAILRYSRDVAFAAADVYARAAEARGLWDVRLEALVVDSILTGEADDELPSRIAALGWHGHGEVAVLVGTATPQFDVDHLRRTARRLHADVLIGVQGSRLVVVIGKALPHGAKISEEPFSFSDIAHALTDQFGPGHLVLGHVVPSLVDSTKSAKAALAGFAVVRSWRKAPRLVSADDLLPERSLAGDPLARATLVHRVYRPLQARSSELLLTLWSYLESGRSLEATSRDLFVHPNTVRYRLKRVTELLGWDATIPRDAFVLHTALVVGATAIPGAQHTAPRPP